jgi:hypothetical protein
VLSPQRQKKGDCLYFHSNDAIIFPFHKELLVELPVLMEITVSEETGGRGILAKR